MIPMIGQSPDGTYSLNVLDGTLQSKLAAGDIQDIVLIVTFKGEEPRRV